MIYNLAEYVKNNLFEPKIEKSIVLSDSEIITSNKFEKIEIQEPVGQILALAKAYKYVFVVLDKLNWDSIYRLYKNFPSNVCVLNLNSGYTGLGKKYILADMDDIYINPLVEVVEPLDVENLNFYIKNFVNSPKLTHIRVPYKEVEFSLGNEEINLDYSEIVDFSEFGVNGFSGAILCYGSVLQETLNAVGLLQAEGLGVDLYWLGNYKQDFSAEIIRKLDTQDKVFIVGDFDPLIFRDFIYSKFFEFNLNKEIYFITPVNLKNTLTEYLSEQVKMQGTDIYERIRKNI